MKKRIAFLLLPLFFAACGDNKAGFVIAPVEAAEKTRLRVSTIEVRDVSLPAYAAASEIVIEDAEGALRPVAKAIWADDPPRAVTGALARSLDAMSTAAVAVEPWPLSESPAVEVTVRIDQMIARANGTFELTGQFAVTSPSGVLRDKLQRFAIAVPMEDTSPASIAASTGKAIEALASEILTQLRR